MAASRGIDPSSIIRRLSSVDREPAYECLHALPHRVLDQRILLHSLFEKHVQHLGDQLADLAELGDAEPTGGASGSAESDARCDRRLLRVEGNAVLVTRDMAAS